MSYPQGRRVALRTIGREQILQSNFSVNFPISAIHVVCQGNEQRSPRSSALPFVYKQEMFRDQV